MYLATIPIILFCHSIELCVIIPRDWKMIAIASAVSEGINIQPVEETGATTRPRCTTGAGKSNEENCRKSDNGNGMQRLMASNGEAKDWKRADWLAGIGRRVQRDRNVNERSANRKPHTYLPRKCSCLSFICQGRIDALSPISRRSALSSPIYSPVLNEHRERWSTLPASANCVRVNEPKEEKRVFCSNLRCTCWESLYKYWIFV